MTERLDRDQWVEAGLATMARSGIEAVRVERLAQQLGVTKGSFYWHFKDRGALHAAMLDAWAAKSTDEIIRRADEAGEAKDKLKRLFEIVSASDGQMERALRSWAAQNEAAAGAAKTVDGRRLRYLQGLFTDLGFQRSGAVARARLVYQAYIGQIMAVAPASAEQMRREWVELIYPMLVSQAAQIED